MKAWMQPVLDWATAYYGNKWYLLFALIAYVYLFFATKESRRKFGYPCLLIAFLVLNPILYKYVYSKIIYWRLMWLLPNSMAIAYATVLFVKKRKYGWVKIAFFTIAIFVIIFKGTNVYKLSGMIEAANEQKVAAAVQQVCDEMLAVDKTPRCIVPVDMSCEIRQYSGNIEQMYGRNADGYINTLDDLSQRIANEVSKETPDYNYVFAQAMAKNYNFIVLEDWKEVPDDILNSYGYILYSNKAGYNLYYCADVERRNLGGYIVTQYGSIGRNTCYTIEDKDNNLIIIDGGYSWYEDKLRALIRAHNNHVIAWIVTSPIDNCAHAFCEIIKDKQGIQIDSIYTVYISDARHEAAIKNNTYTTDLWKTMTELLKEEKNVTYVKENDTFEVLGLNFKALHAWDEETDEIGSFEYSNGSLCFTIQGSEEQLLYLSKLTANMESSLIERHGDELKSDYVQINDNGMWTMNMEFYDRVSPRYVFMDCGSDYLKPGIYGSGAWDLYNYMPQRFNAQVGIYDTVPNWIVLK